MLRKAAAAFAVLLPVFALVVLLTVVQPAGTVSADPGIDADVNELDLQGTNCEVDVSATAGGVTESTNPTIACWRGAGIGFGHGQLARRDRQRDRGLSY
jgi:hypothetical protein